MILAAAALPNPVDVTPEGHWRTTAYDAAFAALSAAGIRHFELSRTRRLTIEAAGPLRERAARKGLTAVALHAPSLHGPDEIPRQLAVSATAHVLGAPVVVFHVSGYRYGHREPWVRQETRHRDRERIRALGEYLGERGMRLALENGSRLHHSGYLQEQVAAAAAVGLTNVGIAFDTGHANMRGELAHQVAAEVAPLVLHTHIHDNHGRRDEHLPPGQGDIRWPRLVSALFAARYAGAWCLELKERPSRDLTEKLEEGRLFLERLLSLS